MKYSGIWLLLSSVLFENLRFVPSDTHYFQHKINVMSRKKKATEDIDMAQNYKFTLYQLATDYYQTSEYLSPEDRMFCTLLLAGYSGAAAYRASYITKATAASSAVLASRKLQEPQIQGLLAHINENYWAGQIVLNTSAYKGKSKRWPKWMPKKKRNLEPSD